MKKQKKNNFILIEDCLVNLNNVDRAFIRGDSLRVDYSSGSYSEFPMSKAKLKSTFNGIKDYLGVTKEF